MTRYLLVRGALENAARVLNCAGVEAPLADARILLAHALEVPLSRLDVKLSCVIDRRPLERFEAFVKDRAARRPLAYITGDTEFMGLPLKCDERALAPRPETEILVQAVATRLGRSDLSATILDLGAGTGAIGLSLAALVPTTRAILTDISADALELARENVEALGVADRVKLLEGPDLEPVLGAGLAEEITCLVSNPPYVAPADVAGLPPEVAVYEPQIAWRGEGEFGLGAYERLIPRSAASLPGVRLAAFEVGIGQAESVRNLCLLAWPSLQVSIVRDLSDIDRVVIAEAPGP